MSVGTHSGNIYLSAATSALEPAADTLAEHYGLPREPVAGATHYLLLTEQRLELRSLADSDTGPIYVDWVTGAVGHRRRFGGGRGQPIAKAVGLKAGNNPSVVDATAGLGRDGFVLANLGCTVTLVERSAVVAALLADGHARAVADAEIGSWVAERMTVVHADAIIYLNGIAADAQPDVVYLDPMYPGRHKSSQVKKEMRALQCVLGTDPDVDKLLPAALAAAGCRVVVKRPMQAQALAGMAPTMAIKGKKHRYDVYVKKAMNHG